MNAVLSTEALTGSAVLVTGASSGIGAEVARAAAACGARVVVHGRDNERLSRLLDELPGKGHGIVVADLTADGLDSVVKSAVAQVGPLSGLVHAAGVHSAKPLRALRAVDIESTMQVNVTAAALLLKSLRMPAHRAESVSVVLVSSVAGVVGQAGVAAYAACKGAVLSLSRSLAIELASERIRVNCVVPGMVPTPMSEGLMGKLTEEQRAAVVAEHPLGLGSVADVAVPIVFLLSEGSRWMTGSAMHVDGGFTAR
jgi:NAD(P)-dependent dehydrogenase (short-subunit alcohol dehydrogenase family)